MASKRKATDDIDALRLRSRQEYLQKREELKLAELRKIVNDEREEEEEARRSGKRLSERELREFRKNRETLRLATERLQIDDALDGYILPDASFSNRDEVLTRRHKEKEYVSEVAEWENEQAAKAKAAQVHKTGPEVEDDYEFVFDEQQHINWGKLPAFQDPEKQMLQAQLDAAEQKVKTIAEVRKSLPMYKYREQLLEALKDNYVLVIVGETGSGKSTQLPQYMYETGYCENGMIGITQPRRVAAMSLAARVSEEVGCRLGNEVGYNIRFDDKTSEKTKIKFLTDGMLLRELMTDPALTKYSCIMLDEAHERTTNTDVLMGLLKQVARLRKENFRLIISSATLDAQKFSQFFDDCNIFSVEGRTFPVERLYLPNPEASYLSAAITTVFQIHLTMPLTGKGGDILVFLTGVDEIEAMVENLQETSRKLGSKAPELIVRPLYSQLDTDQQQLVFLDTPPKARKVIVATNVAETSLTVDGISYVIDCGYTKENQFNATTGMSSLVVTPCSRASINQRAGRAGRTGKGVAFHLFTKWSFYHEMDANTTPEIQRVDLTPVCLLLKSLQINDVLNFDFMDPPPPETLAKSLESLYALGAINDKGVLTRMGRSMVEMPLDVMLSKAILASNDLGCVAEVLTIAAMISEAATLFLRPKDKKIHADAARNRFVSAEGGDHLTLLSVYNAWKEADYDPLWAKENYLQQRTLQRARSIRDQLEKLCERVEVDPNLSAPADFISIRKAITAGFFPHAACMARDGQSYRTIKNGQTASIHPSSCLMAPERRPRWLLYHELVLTSKEFMRYTMPIDPEWLVDVAPHMYSPQDLDKLGGEKKVSKGKGKVGIDGR